MAALSGPVDPARLEAGLATLRRLGFEPVAAANLASRRGLFAGGDQERLDGFHELVADRSIRAVLFARGGHGLLRLLPAIDWDLLARHPRAYVGYSDLTPLLLAIVERLRLVAFHGPMVAAELAEGLQKAEEEAFLGALRGRPRLAFGLDVRDGAVAEGPLLGGCLSLLTATVGTPWSPVPGGAVLFWEETNEPLYRLDRQLVQLELAGVLSGIAGMVVGHVTPDVEAPEDYRARWHELVDEHLGRRGLSLGTGLAAGHERPNLTLPLGVTARLDPHRGALTVSDPD